MSAGFGFPRASFQIAEDLGSLVDQIKSVGSKIRLRRPNEAEDVFAAVSNLTNVLRHHRQTFVH
jgi:hypothetical protein